MTGGDAIGFSLAGLSSVGATAGASARRAIDDDFRAFGRDGANERKIDPARPAGQDGSARPVGAGRGCADGASPADRSIARLAVMDRLAIPFKSQCDQLPIAGVMVLSEVASALS